jgi:hypothetical protein
MNEFCMKYRALHQIYDKSNRAMLSICHRGALAEGAQYGSLLLPAQFCGLKDFSA